MRMFLWSAARTARARLSVLVMPGAAVVIVHSKGADQEMVTESGLGEGEILQIDVEFRDCRSY